MTGQRFLIVSMGTLVLGGLLGTTDLPLGAQGGTDLPSISQNIGKSVPAAQRFVILPAFNGEAVLDKETGLLWEKSPQTTTARWSAARRICTEKSIGGQTGWRLPSLPELRSLVDPSVTPPGPTLPPGHPFLTVQSAVYWSETRVGDNPSGAWAVHFGLGGGSVFINWAHGVQVWCVHGDMKTDPH